MRSQKAVNHAHLVTDVVIKPGDYEDRNVLVPLREAGVIVSGRARAPHEETKKGFYDWKDPTCHSPELIFVGNVDGLTRGMAVRNLRRSLIILRGETQILMVGRKDEPIRFPARILPLRGMTATQWRTDMREWSTDYPLFDKMHAFKKDSPWFESAEAMKWSVPFSATTAQINWPSLIRGWHLTNSYSGSIQSSSPPKKQVMTAWGKHQVGLDLFLDQAQGWQEYVCSQGQTKRDSPSLRSPVGIAFGVLAFRELEPKVGAVPAWAYLHQALAASSEPRTIPEQALGNRNSTLFAAWNRAVNACLPNGTRLNLR